MNEAINPYEVFSIKMNASKEELEETLLAYNTMFNTLYNLYQSYFSKVGMRSTENKLSSTERAENILARRYAFGFDLDKLWLDEKETKDILLKIIRDEEKKVQKSKNTPPIDTSEEITETEQEMPIEMQGPVFSKDERNMRLELFNLSWKDVLESKRSIESTLRALIRDKNDPKTIEQMLDLVISIRYKERLIGIADLLAKNLSKNGIIQSREEFLETLKSTKSYQQLHSMYEQVAIQEKRDELIPGYYVVKNMSDITQLSTVDENTVENLLSREKRYESEYLEGLVSSYLNSEENETVENQDHDYGWGIVLTSPQKLMDNEVVNTPIFKGRITVENIGAFSEHSLFKKRKYEREHTVKIRERSHPKRGLFQMKLERKPSQKIMREYYYRHEACRKLSDNILKVTKTDTQGRTTTNVIFSPLENVGLKGSALSEFIKNVYLSDYMLEMAQKNGGYAGRIMQNENGFFVSNKFNYEEIGSAILFQHGQKGDILDNRDSRYPKKHTAVTKDEFLELINQKEREKEFNE